MSEQWISAEQMEYLKQSHDGKTCARLPYCTDCDLLARIRELERHQAEDRAAVRALILPEAVFAELLWQVAGEDGEQKLGIGECQRITELLYRRWPAAEHAAAIQRAREQAHE